MIHGAEAVREYGRIRRAGPPPPPPPFGIGPGLLKPLKAPAPSAPVAGAVLWLDGNYSGNSVSHWIDRTGLSGNTNLQGSASLPVTLVSNAVNGNAAYHFDGGQYMAIGATGYALEQAMTIFAVVQVDVGTNTNGGVIAIPTGAYEIDFGGGGSGGLQSQFGGGVINGSSVSGLGTPQILVLNANESTLEWTMTRNGTVVGTHSYTAPSPSSFEIFIGYGLNVSGATFTGYLCEIISYSANTGAALTSDQIATNLSYLSAKWL